MVRVVNADGKSQMLEVVFEIRTKMHMDGSKDDYEKMAKVTDFFGNPVDHDFTESEYITADGVRWKAVHD